MNFEDERFVKIYTRDTVTWKLLGWEGRCVLAMLLRKVDRAGCLDVPPEGMEGLCLLLDLPEDITERGLSACLRRGCVVHTGTVLTIPRFIAGQESRQSDKLRQQESRSKRRDCAMRGINVPAAKTWVYFIRDVDAGTIKIGYAADVRSRLNNISGGRPGKYQLLATYPGGIDEERIEHARWKALRIGSTEWFNSSDELETYIQVVTGCDQISRDVTSGHALSHDVTPRLDQTRSEQINLSYGKPNPLQPDLPLQPQQAAVGGDNEIARKSQPEAAGQAKASTAIPKPQVARQIALTLFGELQAARKRCNPNIRLDCKIKNATDGIERCLKDGSTPDDIRHVIACWEALVKTGARRMQDFDHMTPFSPSKVGKYLMMTLEDAAKPRPGYSKPAVPEKPKTQPKEPSEWEKRRDAFLREQAEKNKEAENNS